MAMTWSDRLDKVVLPALKEGLHIYTGLGELRPGPGLAEKSVTADAAASKPMYLPKWQAYMGAKDGQPALRFLQLEHLVRNLSGPLTMLYPSRGGEPKGVHLIVRLGEGLETPETEMLLARTFQAEFMYRPVKVIALGRHRIMSAIARWEVCEHLLMEIYSEAGDLLWTNPYIGMTLEEALEAVRTAELVRSRAHPAAPVAAPPPKVTPHAQPAVGPSEPGPQLGQDKRARVHGTIQQLVGQGMDSEEIIVTLARTIGYDPKVARRLYDDWRKRNEPAVEHQAIVRNYAAQFDGFYEGEELLEAVAEASELSLDIVRRVLELGAPLPQVVPLELPALPPLPGQAKPKAPAPTATPTAILSMEELTEASPREREFSAEIVGVVTDPRELPARPAPAVVLPKPAPQSTPKPRVRPQPDVPKDPVTTEAEHFIKHIHDNVEKMQSTVLAHLAASGKGQAAAALRALCGIPVIGKTAQGPGKQVLDHFRRTVLDPLVASHQIDGSGQGRAHTYVLVRPNPSR